MLGRGYPIDLEVTLADHFPEEDARTIAYSLVDQETTTTRFFGLTDACETALYWDAGVHDILQCDITNEGVDGLIRLNIAGISSVSELDAWIHHASDLYFAWIAPAYR